jgi:beta-phosphoglucomutase
VSPKNFIFDLDGVLIESEHLHAKAKKITLAAFGIHISEEAFQKKYTGISDHAFWIEMKEEYPELTQEIPFLVQYKKDVYAQMTNDLQSIDGSVDFLKWLKEKGKRLGVVTSSDTFYQSIAFDFLGINNLIDLLVNADQVSKYKPDPEPYLKMLEKLGDPLSDSIVIEDSPSGIKAASTAGFFVIGMTSSFEASALIGAGANMTINSYEELKKHLR